MPKTRRIAANMIVKPCCCSHEKMCLMAIFILLVNLHLIPATASSVFVGKEDGSPFLSTKPRSSLQNCNKLQALLPKEASQKRQEERKITQEGRAKPKNIRSRKKFKGRRGKEINRAVKHKNNKKDKPYADQVTADPTVDAVFQDLDREPVTGGAKVTKGIKDSYDKNHTQPLPKSTAAPKGKGKTSTSSVKSKGKATALVRGKNGKSAGIKGKKGTGKYFEADLLLETTLTGLTSDELRQLGLVVAQTYNSLSLQNCDWLKRELTAMSADPTPSQTGYILHLQGSCEGCNPAYGPLFGSPEDQIFLPALPSPPPPSPKDKNNKESRKPTFSPTEVMMGGNTNTTSAPSTNSPTGNSTINGTMPPSNGGTPAEFSPAGRTINGLLQRKPHTKSKIHSRLRKPGTDDDDGQQTYYYRNYGNQWYYSTTSGGTHGRRLEEVDDRAPNVDRHPDPKITKKVGATDRVDILDDDRTYGDDDNDPLTVQVTPTAGKDEGESASHKNLLKGYRDSSLQPISPLPDQRSTVNATYNAPYPEDVVYALNNATVGVRGRSLDVTNALQVEAVTCPAVEELFETALVIQFTGQATPGQSLSTNEIALVEQTIMRAYNHLQATSTCDAPQFREIHELILNGFAQGQTSNTFLVMFLVRASCRGLHCNSDATLFDSNQGRRQLQNYLSSGSHYSHMGRNVQEAAVASYQEQCYCHPQAVGHGSPTLTGMEAALTDAIQQAFTSIVTVVDIVETSPPQSGGTGNGNGNEYNLTPAPTPLPAGTEKLRSSMVVQFFGARNAVREDEVSAIEEAMPKIYQSLQNQSFCDPENRILSSATLNTVDPGPTADSFLLGFVIQGTCQGNGCSSNPMFFARSAENMVSCGAGRNHGPPIISDFGDDLFESIMSLRDDGILQNIESSGNVVEILMDSTPAPILSAANTLPVAPATTARQFQNRGSQSTFAPTSEPTYYPTWLDSSEAGEKIPPVF